jgi:hypothetical protein
MVASALHWHASAREASQLGKHKDNGQVKTSVKQAKRR